MMTEKELRKKLLRWHYNKLRTPKMLDLLQSDYQIFRYKVERRIGIEQLDFRQAIKSANEDELYDLQNIIDEDKIR